MLMDNPGNVSLVGITFALGGLGLIATFFAIVGHYFKKSADKKKTPKRVPSSTTAKERNVNANHIVQPVVEKREDENVESETVAAITAAVMAYASKGSKIVSIKRANEERKKNKSLWRLHKAQTTWRIKRIKKGAMAR